MHLAVLGEDFGGYPMLESFGTFGFGGEDEGIEAGLVDEGGLLLSTH